MPMYEVVLNFAEVFSAPSQCPFCTSGHLQPHRVGDSVAFICADCSRGWRPGFGRGSEVRPMQPERTDDARSG